jgi:hypothetical protein
MISEMAATIVEYYTRQQPLLLLFDAIVFGCATLLDREYTKLIVVFVTINSFKLLNKEQFSYMSRLLIYHYQKM